MEVLYGWPAKWMPCWKWNLCPHFHVTQWSRDLGESHHRSAILDFFRTHSLQECSRFQAFLTTHLWQSIFQILVLMQEEWLQSLGYFFRLFLDQFSWASDLFHLPAHCLVSEQSWCQALQSCWSTLYVACSSRDENEEERVDMPIWDLPFCDFQKC